VSKLIKSKIPEDQQSLEQWACYKLEPDGKGKKPKKRPYSPIDGLPVGPHDHGHGKKPNRLTNIKKAIAAKKKHGFDGVSFLLTEWDDFCVIDTDDVRDPRSGEIKPWAMKLISRFNTRTEVSHGHGGFHQWFRGKKPGRGCRKHHELFDGDEIELYDRERYIAVTGYLLNAGTPETIENRQEELDEFYKAVWGEDEERNAKPSPPLPPPSDKSDADLLDIAMRDAKFYALWSGDMSGYPGNDGKPDHSAADMALAQKICFYFGPDPGKIDSMFRRSQLMRPKWDERRKDSTYGRDTITRAIQQTTEHFDPSSPPSDRRARSPDKRRSKLASHGKDVGEAGWPDIIPFDRPSKAPDFPVEVLPYALAEHAKDISYLTQTPIDAAANLMIGALATAAGDKWKVTIENMFSEHLAMWPLIVMKVGERKSTVYDLVMKPLEERRWRDIETYQKELPVIQAERDIQDKRIETLKKEMARERDQHELAAMREDLKQKIEDLTEIPEEPDIFTSDITPEELVYAMKRQGGAITMGDPEGGGIVAMMAGRYSNQVPNLETYLKGHSGETCQAERRKGGKVVVRKACLSVVLCVQPITIQQLTTHDEFKGRGILGRFLYSWPQSLVGYRKEVEGGIRADIEKMYHDTLIKIFDKETPQRHTPIMIAGEAKKVWRQFERDTETEMREGNRLGEFCDWGNKICGVIARLAALLQLWEDPDSEKVSVANMARACQWGEYFKDHALVCFGYMGFRS